MTRISGTLAGVLAGTLASTLLALAAPSAAARTGDGLTPGHPVHLALGDSVAAGQQSTDPVLDAEGDLDYAATAAAWHANGYVALLVAALRADLDCLPAASSTAADGCRHLQLYDLSRTAVPAVDGQPARPGVTTQQLIEEQLPVATALLQARNGDRNPRNDVEVVTLTVGGNDIFGPLRTACLSGPVTDCPSAVQSAFVTFQANYSSILAQLREAAGPGTPILTMTYYNPLPFCALGQQQPLAGALAGWVLEGGTLPGLGTLESGFNDLIRAISAQHGARVADTYGDLGAGDLVGGADCLHPTGAGHALIAAAFEEAFAAIP